MKPIATVEVRHIGDDYATIIVHISVPGDPGQSYEIDTDRELGVALLKAGCGYEENEI